MALLGNIAQAQPQPQKTIEFEGGDNCLYGQKIYSVGAAIQDKSGQTLTCKKYDAIIPRSGYQLEKGYDYWEEELAVDKVALPI